MYNHTYKDTTELLGLGLLIILISWAGSFFLSSISIFLIGLYVSFGNRAKELSKKLIEIDRINKKINDESRRKD